MSRYRVRYVSVDVPTRRQAEILIKMAEGKTYREIASELGIGWKTVKKHASALYGRLGVVNSNEAIAEGFRRGILE